ncbi:hypothetical protein [Nostoc sp.]|uniref:hypothetical protein n=1 Tax=Nostoc sp. TaxID=1180 RepID=UPI002FF5754D
MSQPQTKIIEELFASLGRMSWQSFVKNRLPLLNLPADVLEVLRSGRFEYTKAKAIARVQDDETRKELLEDVKVLNLSLSEIKRKIQEIESAAQSKSLSQTESASIKQHVSVRAQRLVEKKCEMCLGRSLLDCNFVNVDEIELELAARRGGFRES